jgi:hypothetical protein
MRTVLRTRFGREYEHFIRQTAERMNTILNFWLHLQTS